MSNNTIRTINSIEEDNTRLNSIDDDQKTLMEKKGYAMVGNKGHSFPMLQKDPVEIQKEKMMKAEGTQPPTVNRAGVPEKTLVNNPNVNQPMDKISANQFSREQMFGKMAMDPGQKFEQPGATTTPVAFACAPPGPAPPRPAPDTYTYSTSTPNSRHN